MSKAKLGSIYPRGKKGILWVDFWANGKQHQESTHTTDYKKAELYLKRRQGEVAAGTFMGLQPERVSFHELSQLIVDDYIRQEKHSLGNVKRRLRLHLIPALGKVRAAAFGTSHLHRYIDQRKQEGAENASINRELSIVRRVFNLAIKHDPPLVVRRPTVTLLHEDNVRTGFLEDEQYKRLREALPEEIRPLLVVGYHLGCRVGELKPLKWTEVDFKAREIRLYSGTTKNKEGRTMPIYGEMLPWLKIEKELRDQNCPECPYVFRRGGMPIKNFVKSWKTACMEAGVPGLIFHDLRRSAVRLMSRAGIPEKVIMQVTGHKTRSIFDRYNIVSQRDLDLFRGRMDAHVQDNSGAAQDKSQDKSVLGAQNRKERKSTSPLI